MVNNLSHILGVKLAHWERCIGYIGSSATKTVRMIWALSCYTVLSSKGFQQDNVNCINKHWDWLNQQDGSVSVSKIDIVGKPWVGQEPGRSHQGSAGAMAEPGSFMAVVSLRADIVLITWVGVRISWVVSSCCFFFMSYSPLNSWLIPWPI